MTHRFAWRNNPVRAMLFGQRCRILATGALGSVAVLFASGEHYGDYEARRKDGQ